MFEKHQIYHEQPRTINEACTILEDKISNVKDYVHLILEKLFTGLLWNGLTLSSFYDRVNITNSSSLTEDQLVRGMSDILSEYESLTLLDMVINKPSINKPLFL